MKKLSLPLKKSKKTVIGLMSGTSLDSVDAALVEIRSRNNKPKVKQLDYISFPFPDGLKEILLANSNPNSGNVSDICRLNFLMANLYSDAVKKIIKKNKLKTGDIDFIGSHGQTIHHLPKKEKFFNYEFGSTLQIGDPAVIAKKTGIMTVGDFRTGDVALNGEGAPLIPYFDYMIFGNSGKDSALLNIGGISNITFLKKKASFKKTIAFDTGPGNMMIDLLCRKFYNKEYDKEGNIARSGKVNQSLLDFIISKDNFIERKPPKSTGREYYGEEFLNSFLLKPEFKDIPPEDIIATITEFTAYAVFKNFELHIKKYPHELIVSGGGAENKFLMERLGKYFGHNCKVKKINDSGITSEAKEAVCFAFLAHETLSLRGSNIPNVTGAEKQTILGKICLP